MSNLDQVIACDVMVTCSLCRLRFPQIIVLYSTITAVVGQLFILVAYAGGDKVFCGGRSYIDAIQQPTKFCIATGEQCTVHLKARVILKSLHDQKFNSYNWLLNLNWK